MAASQECGGTGKALWPEQCGGAAHPFRAGENGGLWCGRYRRYFCAVCRLCRPVCCVPGRGESRGRAASRLKRQGFTCLAVAHAVTLHQEGNAVTAGPALAAQEGSTTGAASPDNETIFRGTTTQGAGPGVFVRALCFEEPGRKGGQNIFIHIPAPHPTWETRRHNLKVVVSNVSCLHRLWAGDMSPYCLLNVSLSLLK